MKKVKLNHVRKERHSDCFYKITSSHNQDVFSMLELVQLCEQSIDDLGADQYCSQLVIRE